MNADTTTLREWRNTLILEATICKRRVRQRLAALPDRGPLLPNRSKSVPWTLYQRAVANHIDATARVTYIAQLISQIRKPAVSL